MSAQRKVIRKKLVSILKRAQTIAGERVYSNDADPALSEKLPSIFIRVVSETAEEWTQAPRIFKRTIAVAIECLCDGRNPDEAADFVDDLSEQVERVIGSDDSLDGTAEDTRLAGVELDFIAEAEKPIATSTLTFNVLYLTAAPRTRNDQEQKPLASVHADWQIEGRTDEATKAEDTIQLPQT
jgi:hypothetical protein